MTPDRSNRLLSQTGTRGFPSLMGVLNVTPDSFYDGGEYTRVEQAVKRVRRMVEAGADIIDVGGESTRPGAERVSVEEEIERVVPVIEAVREEGIDVPISVDTRKSGVAGKALDIGADWVNDVSGLRHDPDLAGLVADREVPIVLMHMQGTPETMQDDPQYDDVVEEVCEFFRQRIEYARSAGIRESQIILDPGIGFGKTNEHNRTLLTNIDRLKEQGRPVLIGHSRKSFLTSIIDGPPEERLVGTLSVSAHLGLNEVNFLRIHDVAEHQEMRATFEWLGEGHDEENE